MSSWSDSQASVVTVSGWFGERKVERNFPPNICIRGDSTDFCSCSYISTADLSAEISNNWRTVRPRTTTSVGSDSNISRSSTPGVAAAKL